MFRVVFFPILENSLVLAVLLLVLGGVIVGLVPRGERLTVRGRRVLVVLRLAAFFFLLVAMLRPTVLHTETRRLAASLHIVLDTSESMSVADEVGGKSRYATAVDALRDAESALYAMQRDRLDVAAFTFDRSVASVPVKNGALENLPEQPLGKETALGFTLEQILLRSSGKRILGTILLTDGTQRSLPPRDGLPQDAAARYKDAGTPLFPVQLGLAGTGNTQDVAVTELQANDRVFVKNELVVVASIRVAGYVNRRIPVDLLFENERGEMEPVASQEVLCREDGQILPVRFAYAPQKTGLFKYTVEVPPQSKELVATNNALSGFVRVVEGGLDVLYLQGERRTEHRFLRDALDASPDIHVRYHRFDIEALRPSARSRSQRLEDALAEATARRASLVEEYFAPQRFMVYILDDLDAKAFKPEELAALAELVREGAGLIMLGGFHAFGAGGYDATPLKDVAPVVMSPLDRQSLDAPPRMDRHLERIRMVPNARGAAHSVLKLDTDPARSDAIWKEMPELAGANRFGAIKPGATVLAEGPAGEPLLVAQLFGAGRVLAFAGDSTWRWAMHGFRDQQKRFWRQTVLWLAKMDDSTGNDCWITLDKTRLYPGETASFQVFLKSQFLASQPGEETVPARATAVLVAPDGTEEEIPMLDVNGTPGGTLRVTERPGDYTIKVRATEREPAANGDGGNWHEATARFMVFDRNLELDNPVAYPKLLESMAATTGGRTVVPEQIGLLLEELQQRADELIERRETKSSLYDNWPFLLLFTGIMGIEWFCRKKWGLV